MNIKRIKVCTAIITAIILVISGANISQAVQASEDSLSVAGSEISELTSNASTTVSIETETTTSEATSENHMPRLCRHSDDIPDVAQWNEAQNHGDCHQRRSHVYSRRIFT
jgi:cytoskeletal protein RodZ